MTFTNQIALLVIIAVLLALFLVLPSLTDQTLIYEDWIIYFKPAALAWHDPFLPGIFNPPWLFVLLHPLSILPDPWGIVVLMIFSVGVVMLYLRSPAKSFFVLTSAPMVSIFLLGQVDIFPLVGLMVTPALSLPFLAVKPQGVFLAALPRLSRKSLTVLAITLLLSVALWGLWPFKLDIPDQHVYKHNMALFPWSIPLALPLLWLGLRRKSDALLCWASLCLAPYFVIVSALPATAASLRELDDWRGWLAVWAGTWVYLFLIS